MHCVAKHLAEEEKEKTHSGSLRGLNLKWNTSQKQEEIKVICLNDGGLSADLGVA